MRHTLYLYVALFILVGTLSLQRATAQTETTLIDIDSLYQTVAEQSGYYPQQQITSPKLQRLIQERLGKPSPVVEYLAKAPMPQEPTMLGAKLNLPLLLPSTLGDTVGRTSERLQIIPKLPLSYRSAPRDLLPKRDLALEAEMGLYTTLMAHLRSTSLQHFDYFVPDPNASTRLAISSNSQIDQTFGERKIKVETMQQVAENMKIQDIGLRYWQPDFEVSLQLSQSHVSDNWYKGGSSNLNLYMRTYGAMTYQRGKIKWKNELEDKLSIYNMDKNGPGGAGRGYRVADDQIRLRSNFGLRASKRWFYTLDAETRTQLLTTYKGDSNDIQSSPLAPLTINVGLGMKFDYTRKSTSVYQRKVVLSMNIAPLSYTYRSTIRPDIDLARHGLAPDRLYYHRIGSTLRASLQWDINMNVSWTSKLYFNTSYSNVEAEWENTLNMRIGRFFSTRINLQLRFDDSARPSDKWNRYLQYNELLSFGFNYKF